MSFCAGTAFGRRLRVYGPWLKIYFKFDIYADCNIRVAWCMIDGKVAWWPRNHAKKLHDFTSMTLFRQNSDADYQSGTSKLQQKFNNRQNIQEKNEIDHNFNIELSILNIENFYNISFFWLSSWWWSKSSKVMFLSKKLYLLLKNRIFSKNNVIFQSHFSQECSLKIHFTCCSGRCR